MTEDFNLIAAVLNAEGIVLFARLFAVVATLGMVGIVSVVAYDIVAKTGPFKRLTQSGGLHAKASVARVQFLLVSIAMATLVFLQSAESGLFVDVPPGVQVVFGISAATYLIAKLLDRYEKRNHEELDDERDLLLLNTMWRKLSEWREKRRQPKLP